jgi:glycosyltransferase involved in cell wall biosynthesis
MPDKLRICLISREYPPDTGWGGIATFARHLAQGLKEIGHDVTVISLAKDKAKIVDTEGIRVHRVESYLRESDLGLLARCIPYSRYVISSSAALWQRFLELHQEQPFDVVDTPELLAEGLFPAITKAAPFAVRLYTPHSKFIAEGLHNVSASFDHQFVAMLERVAMLNADAITSPSRDLAQYVAGDLNYPVERIKVVLNPIDANEFCPEGPKAIPADDKLKVLFVGRLEERKGIKYLIQSIPEVVRRVPNAHFCIIGDDTNNGRGQKSVLAELKQYIADAKCSDNITFIARVPLVELPAYYRSADVAAVPSVYDNSPYSCLEAMSCGRAVIATTSGGAPEYIGNADCGRLVPAKDVAALTEALVELLQDEALRKRLGANARQRVMQVFQRAEIARQTTEVYESARQSFVLRKQTPQYMRSPSEALADMESIASAFNMMVHNLLYQGSIRYRIAHWVHMGRMRPKLLAAKVALRVTRKIEDMTGARGKILPKHVEWLEQEIRSKDLHPTPRQRLLSATAEGKSAIVGDGEKTVAVEVQK